MFSKMHNYQGYKYRVSNGYAPTTTSGTAVTSSSTANQYGSWTEVLDTLDASSLWVHLNIHNTFASGTARNSYFDIGYGQSSSSVVAVAEKLAVCNTAPIVGSTWMFPLYIPAGEKVFVKHQCSVSSITGYVQIGLIGGGMQGYDSIKVQRIEPIGYTSGSTTGTSITIATGAQGSWTQLSSSTPRRYIGLMSSQLLTTSTSRSQYSVNTIHIGVGNGSSTQCVGYSAMREYVVEVDERLCSMHIPVFTIVPVSSYLYAAAQGISADSNMSVILYGMRG
jgi:hypothetical protein